MESQSIEYKSDIPKKSSQLKAEMVGFLNSNDGTIYLGVDDDGKPIPEKKSKFKEWELLITEWINNAFNTSVHEFIKIKVTDEAFGIHIKKGDKPPYYYKEGEGFNLKGIYIRVGSSKRRADDDEVRRMLKAQVADEFDSQPIKNDKTLSFQYLRDKLSELGIDFDKNGLRLLSVNKKYNNNALLLSDQNPFCTKIAVIDGLDMASDFLAKKEFNGSLIKQIDMTLEYISLLNDKKVSFTGAAARLEHEGYPSKAVREAVINAYAHRDYSLSADIKVEIYDDRMEIFSAGGIPDGISVSDIKKGISARRNPSIVHVLDKIRYIENFATGIRRILASYKGFDKEPEFDVTPNQFKVVLYNRHYSDSNIVKQSPQTSIWKDALSDGEQLELGFINTDGIEEVNEENQQVQISEPSLESNDEKIIKLLKLNDEMSRKEIQEYLKESKTKTYQRLKKLIEIGFINTRGQNRSVVYYLTDNERK